MNVYLEALKHDKDGKWDLAHDLIQHVESNEAAWIHAYLHRKEGDDFNARYWYGRAGRVFPNLTLDEEWDQLYEELSNTSR